MKSKSVKRDWNELIEQEFSNINENINEEWIINQSETVYKNNIKEKVRHIALKKFNAMKEKHSKIKDLVYENLNRPQPYITSNKLNNKLTSIMVNLRSKCLQGFKKNFVSTHSRGQECPLCGKDADTQEHALKCHVVINHMKHDEVTLLQQTNYEHRSGTVEEQARLATVFQSILDIRDSIMEGKADQGIILDQQTGDPFV